MTAMPVMFKCGRHSRCTSVQVFWKYVRIVQAFCPPPEHEEICFIQHMPAFLLQAGIYVRIARDLRRDGPIFP
jgi:hypothetical protein